MASTEEITCAIAELIRSRLDCGRAAVSITELATVVQGMVIGESRQSLEKKIRDLASSRGSLISLHDDTVSISEPCSEPG